MLNSLWDRVHSVLHYLPTWKWSTEFFSSLYKQFLEAKRNFAGCSLGRSKRAAGSQLYEIYTKKRLRGRNIKRQ